MATVSETYTTLDKMISEAAKLGIIHHTAEDVELDGRTVLIEGASLIQFGSCSYLGLETELKPQPAEELLLLAAPLAPLATGSR